MKAADLSRKLAGFAVVPFLGAVSPLLLYPVIARRTSIDGWATVALGQSLGALAMMVVTLGWNLVGPSAIAACEDRRRPDLYLESFVLRAVAFSACVPVLVVVAVLLASPGFVSVAILMSLAVASTGLTPAWFAVSTGDSRTLLWFDAMPRVLAAVVSAVLLLTGAPLVTFPVVLLAGSVVGSLLFLTVVLRDTRPRLPSARALRARWRTLVPAATSEVAAGSFAAGAVTMVGLGATVPELALYASGDRLFRLSLYAIATLSNALQAWVAEPAADLSRFWFSLRCHLALGLVGGLALAFLGPPVTGLLFGARLAVDAPTAGGLGAAFLLISVGTSLGRHLLLVRGRRRTFLVATLVALGLGVPALIVLSALFGAAGGAWAVALAEGALALALVVAARGLLSARGARGDAADTPASATTGAGGGKG